MKPKHKDNWPFGILTDPFGIWTDPTNTDPVDPGP